MIRSARAPIPASRWPGPRLITAFVVTASLALGGVVSASGDDRGAAEALVKEAEASPRKELAAEPLVRARAALDRGARLRAAGDESHAKLAESLARTWAETARDVARAGVVEESAAAARRGATDAGALADRERALLEEAIAQSGRVRAQLDAVERDGKDVPARTSTMANTDAGARVKPTTPAAKDGGVR